MHVEDGLPSDGLVGLQQGESLWVEGSLKNLRDPARGDHDCPGQVLVHVEERARVGRGEDESMPASQRCNAEESDGDVVLVQDVGRRRSCSNRAEDAVLGTGRGLPER